LRFGAETRPATPPGTSADVVEPPVPRLDLTAFGPARARAEIAWEHSVRRIDHRFRVRLPEVRQLGEGVLIGRLRSGCWELGPVSRAARTVHVVPIDERERVHLPAGVRHQLGFGGAAVVSLALDRSRILVWPAASLDALLEVLQ
jgi:hypothetical protein